MRGLPVHTDLGASKLRALAWRETRPRVALRLYAIAHALDDVSRTEAARLCSMDHQALRDAVVRFNAGGLGRLVNRRRPGREPRLSESDQTALAGLILRGPRPEHGGLLSWTLADLCQEVEVNWGKRFHPASMSRVAHRLGFSRQKARQVTHNPIFRSRQRSQKRAPAHT